MMLSSVAQQPVHTIVSDKQQHCLCYCRQVSHCQAGCHESFKIFTQQAIMWQIVDNKT